MAFSKSFFAETVHALGDMNEGSEQSQTDLFAYACIGICCTPFCTVMCWAVVLRNSGQDFDTFTINQKKKKPKLKQHPQKRLFSTNKHNLISIQRLADIPMCCHSDRSCPGGTGIVGWVRITHGCHSSVSISTALFQECTCMLTAQLKLYILNEVWQTLWSVLSLEISCSAAECLQEALSFSFGAEHSPVLKAPKDFSPAIVVSFTKSVGPIL